jgi:hypothetical protein
MKNLFSVNKAADLLERDRQTLVRALRHVRPDGTERGQPRYTMRTITDALAAHEAGNNGADAMVNQALQRKFAELEARYDGVQNAPTLAERRKRARAFFPFLAEVESAMYADAKRHGEDPRMSHLRVAEHTRLNLFTLRQALDWSWDEIFAEFLKADPRVHDDD